MTHDASAKAACYQHPLLDPDAWFQVDYGRPINEGIKALVVCRFSCPIKNNCPVSPGPEMIAAGGWFTARKEFIVPLPGFVDFHQAAAYVGLKESTLWFLVKKQQIPVAIEPRTKQQVMPVSAMLYLAKFFEPQHGTVKMHETHLIRGEQPCDRCANGVKQGSLEERQLAVQGS